MTPLTQGVDRLGQGAIREPQIHCRDILSDAAEGSICRWP